MTWPRSTSKDLKIFSSTYKARTESTLKLEELSPYLTSPKRIKFITLEHMTHTAALEAMVTEVVTEIALVDMEISQEEDTAIKEAVDTATVLIEEATVLQEEEEEATTLTPCLLVV